MKNNKHRPRLFHRAGLSPRACTSPSGCRTVSGRWRSTARLRARRRGTWLKQRRRKCGPTPEHTFTRSWPPAERSAWQVMRRSRRRALSRQLASDVVSESEQTNKQPRLSDERRRYLRVVCSYATKKNESLWRAPRPATSWLLMARAPQTRPGRTCGSERACTRWSPTRYPHQCRRSGATA